MKQDVEQDVKRKSALDIPADFARRHIGPRERDLDEMLAELGFDDLDALSGAVVPEEIAIGRGLELDPPLSEPEMLSRIGELAGKNRTFRSFIGMGYHGCVVPPVIQRNVLENPGWYTQYTPYQAEIAQGRLEALINFQTMVSDLTGLPMSNASLLDEATAAAEAMAMCLGRRAPPQERPSSSPRTAIRRRSTWYAHARGTARDPRRGRCGRRSRPLLRQPVRRARAVPDDRRAGSATTRLSPTPCTRPEHS